MKISFDFDGVLDTEIGFTFCESLLHANWLCKGHGQPFQILIVTTRLEDGDNVDLWETMNVLGIKKEAVIFTNHEWKYSFMDDLNIKLHIDDDTTEVHQINEKCQNCKALLIDFNLIRVLAEGNLENI